MRYFRILLSLFAAGLLFSTVALAGDPAAQKVVLDNGMTVLIKSMPNSPSVAIYALVKTGSATEGKYLGSGISHFIEHMLFKGTEDKRSVGEIAETIMGLGGTINASTSYDYTIYTIDLPYSAFTKGLDIMADMITRSQLDPAEVEKERQVIISEMRLHDDHPDQYLGKLLFENAYIRHPYKYPVIGYRSLFEKITRDDLVDYYKSTYVPNNLYFAVAGRLDPDEALTKIRAAFHGFERKNYAPRNLPAEPPQITPRRYEEEYPTDVMRLLLAYSSVSLSDRDVFALDVLAMILGQGETSRLYDHVYKQKGLVRSIDASNYTPMDRGVFQIYALLDQEKLDAARAAIKSEIDSIKENGVTPDELKKSKTQALTRLVFDHQTAGDVAEDMAVYEASIGDYQFPQKYAEAIQSLTVDDIQRVAKQYLSDGALTTVVLKPKREGASPTAAVKTPGPSDIRKIVLDNGLTVLLREDPTFPLVAVQLVLHGGTREENTSMNGISQMVSGVWAKGTKTRSAQQLAQDFESRGASLGGFSGRNSFGLQMNLLSQDLDFGLPVMADVVKNPSFPDDEIVRHKEELLTGIRTRDDSISAVTGKALREILFAGQPSALDPLGTPETLKKISRNDVQAYYARFCVPGNMVLSVFGSFKSDEVLGIIRKNFSDLKKRKYSALPPVPYPLPLKVQEKTLRLDKQQAMVMIGFPGSRLDEADRFGLNVLTTILGSSFQGRLFAKVREELGQAYALGGSFTPGIDPGLVIFYVLTTDAEVEHVKAIVQGEIKRIREELVSDTELANAKTYIEGSFKMSLETNAALGFLTGLDELYGLGFANYRQLDERTERVTKEEVLELARKYLDPVRAAIVITRPPDTKSAPKAPAAP